MRHCKVWKRGAGVNRLCCCWGKWGWGWRERDRRKWQWNATIWGGMLGWGGQRQRPSDSGGRGAREWQCMRAVFHLTLRAKLPGSCSWKMRLKWIRERRDEVIKIQIASRTGRNSKDCTCIHELLFILFRYNIPDFNCYLFIDEKKKPNILDHHTHKQKYWKCWKIRAP